MKDNGFSTGAKMAAGAAAALAAAATAAGVAIVKLTKDQFPAIDKVGKFSREIGMSTESLIAFQHASKIAGMDASSLDKGFKRMLKSVGEARQGLTTPLRGFSLMGLRLDDINELDPEQIFLKIADAVQAMDDPIDKATGLTQIFGRAGGELAVLFEQGAEGLKKAKEEAERLGITFDAVDAAKVEEANDAILRAKQTFKGAFSRLAIDVAPQVEAVGKSMTELMIKLKPQFKQIATGFTEALKVIEKLEKDGTLKKWADGIVGSFDKVITGLKQLKKENLNHLSEKDLRLKALKELEAEGKITLRTDIGTDLKSTSFFATAGNFLGLKEAELLEKRFNKLMSEQNLRETGLDKPTKDTPELKEFERQRNADLKLAEDKKILENQKFFAAEHDRYVKLMKDTNDAVTGLRATMIGEQAARAQEQADLVAGARDKVAKMEKDRAEAMANIVTNAIKSDSSEALEIQTRFLQSTGGDIQEDQLDVAKQQLKIEEENLRLQQLQLDKMIEESTGTVDDLGGV
jgi:hypothetical protein